MNFSEAKILAVPGYLIEIPGSDFPARLMIFHFYLLYTGGFKRSGAGGKKNAICSLRAFRNNNN
jgi:hypothetical protein